MSSMRKKIGLYKFDTIVPYASDVPLPYMKIHFYSLRPLPEQLQFLTKRWD